MASIAWSEVSYTQPALPKLKIAQEMARRDSLSSSRTGDSGYNSDPDISLSPLEFVSPEPVPYTSAAFTLDSSALFDVKEAICSHSEKTPRNARNPINPVLFSKSKSAHPPPTIDVTSAPTGFEHRAARTKNDWYEAEAGDTPAPERVPIPVTSLDIEKRSSTNLLLQQPKERNSSIVSLSSTGSCDMYSNTDDNSEDEEVASRVHGTLSKATLKTIELIMRKIELNLNYAAYMQCAGNQPSRNQGSSGTASRAGQSRAQGSGKRKSRGEDSLPPDDPDEDGSNKRRRISTTTVTEDSENGPRFACPFYKHDPNCYRNRRTCPGPGWPTVHRMKEHLYRSHAQPIFCNRCYLMFDSDNELSTHQRADPCPVSAPQPIDGIGRETLKSLRKRTTANRLEEDKWRDTYQLLFPDVAQSDIPSPYYDSASPSEGSRRFRRDLLERIRQELFTTAEQEPGPVEQRLLRQVAGIIQRCERELMSSPNSASYGTASFNNTSNFLHPAMPTHRRASAPSILADPPQTNVPAHSLPQVPPHQQDMQTSFGAALPGGALSPRTQGSFDAMQQPAASTVYQPDAPTIVYPDSFPFPSSDWIDWNMMFPPGSDMDGQMDGQRGEGGPQLVAPVWT